MSELSEPSRVLRTALGRGFYAVLDRDDEDLARTLAAHAGVLQVRIKPGCADDIVRVARMARRVCSDAGIPLVINDRIDIALAVGADGVHLGQTDLPVRDAAALVATRLALGISTHDLGQVQRAVPLVPAYIAYGPIFETRTKQNPDPVQGLEALRAAVAAAGEIPVVAIGGITAERVAEVYATGATAICAIGAVNRADDVGVTAMLFARRVP